MPEKSDENKSRTGVKKNSGETREGKKKSSLAEDQKNRSYYYDDATGYEVYLPEEDEEEDKPAR